MESKRNSTETPVAAKRVRYSNSCDSDCSISSATTEIIEVLPTKKITLPLGPINSKNTNRPICVVCPRQRCVSPSILEDLPAIYLGRY